MLLEILTVCSLISAAPYYDCSDEWEIRLYSVPPMVQCNDHDKFFTTFGCSQLNRNVIHMVHFPEHRDQFGKTILEHELEHLKCRCNFH